MSPLLTHVRHSSRKRLRELSWYQIKPHSPLPPSGFPAFGGVDGIREVCQASGPGGERAVTIRVRRAVADVAVLCAASMCMPALFAILRRLGFPLGLRVVPMGEDYNWVIILNASSIAAQAQTFWSMNDRNPLSPWWYIIAQYLYMGLPNGPLLTRLAMNPLLAMSAYVMVRCLAPVSGRGLALAVGILVACWTFSTTVDQIYWNFLGALALTMLCIASFAAWSNRSGTGTTGWYGISLCLWFAAFATYTFQVGAVLAVSFLVIAYTSLNKFSISKSIGELVKIVTPFVVMLLLFVLVWTTARNPLMSEYYKLNIGTLFTNLIPSVYAGLSPSRYFMFASVAFAAMGSWAIVLSVLTGILAGCGIYSLVRATVPRAREALSVLCVAFCIILPTVLIESMSSTWSVGMRWVMVDQVWQPLLWLSLMYSITAVWPSLRLAFAFATGGMAACVMLLSLGHNVAQNRAAAYEVALREGSRQIAANWTGRLPLHLIILMEEGTRPDVMNIRIAPIWFGGRSVTLRTLWRGAAPLEASHAEWWDVVFDDDIVRNVAIGGGTASYDQVAIARFDGREVRSVDVLRPEDVVGFPVRWQRSAPLSPR